MRMGGRLHIFLQLSSRFIAVSCLRSGYPTLNVPRTPTELLFSRCLLRSTGAAAKTVSTPMADAISRRREKAAQAAERRLQATATATAPTTAPPSAAACCSSNSEDQHETLKTRHGSGGSCSGGGHGGGSRKRPVEQVVFSDSDSDEVTCVGVSAAVRGITQGRGEKGATFTGRGEEAASNKRGRTDGVSDESYSELYTRASRRPA